MIQAAPGKELGTISWNLQWLLNSRRHKQIYISDDSGLATEVAVQEALFLLLFEVSNEDKWDADFYMQTFIRCPVNAAMTNRNEAPLIKKKKDQPVYKLVDQRKENLEELIKYSFHN